MQVLNCGGARIGGFAEYVCPNIANHVRRQASGAMTLAGPKDQLEDILLQIQQMELTILALIDQYMQDVSSILQIQAEFSQEQM
jgi:hypothetical protein